MNNHALAAAGLALAALLAAAPAAQADTILYSQNFENPTGFNNDGGDFNIFRTVNQLYGNQPAGFSFAQNFTVETLRIGGTQAFGTGYKDPQAIGGQYVLGLLSNRQDDLLGLSFNVGGFKFLNFQLDVSSIDLDRQGGPFVPAGGQVPVYRMSLFDNPGGGTGLGIGAVLATADITGLLSADRTRFDWTRHVVALDASGSASGNVILRIDLLQGGYAAMDNFIIAASDTPGSIPGPSPAPEPGSSVLVGLALAGLVAARRRPVASSRRPTATHAATGQPAR